MLLSAHDSPHSSSSYHHRPRAQSHVHLPDGCLIHPPRPSAGAGGDGEPDSPVRKAFKRLDHAVDTILAALTLLLAAAVLAVAG
ncbi:hypothetical protein QFZ56_000051 [Streptomyces achromogenes]|uniref:Uncharacterized protein n=1 Tax=Streptomyces achromogenes TaxID=67255 RepID=A0ABU0PTW4_STRAH|nr:hypothetical protein [Streptomyces achromogenes]